MKRVLVLFGSLLLACAGRAPRPPRLPPPGPAVVVVPSDSEMVSVHVAFRSGSADDPRGREGLVSLTASLIREGGGGAYDEDAVRARLFPMAASIDVTVAREVTAFEARVHRDHLDGLTTLLVAMLVEPRLPESVLARQRAAAESALRLELRGTDDDALAEAVLDAWLFDGTSYGHPVLGTESGLAAITRDDVLAARATLFCPSRMRVGVTGQVPDGFVERLSAALSAIPDDGCHPVRPPPEAASRPSLAVRLVHKPDATAVAMHLGLRHEVTREHPDYAAMLVAAAYLGLHGQFLGRLMTEVRDRRGLNYGDYVYAEPYVGGSGLRGPSPYHTTRAPLFAIWVRPVQPEHALFVLRLVLGEHERMVEHGIPREGFERVRAFLVRYLPLYAETDEARLGHAMDQAFHGLETEWVPSLRSALEALTVERVNAAITRHLGGKGLSGVLVVPDADAFAARLVRDEPSAITYDRPMPAELLEEDRAIASRRLGLRREDVTIERAASAFE